MLYLKRHSWNYYIPRDMKELLSHIACVITKFSFLSYLYTIFLPRVNYSIINMGYLFYTLLYNIVEKFQHNIKTLLPSKAYNIFQHSPLIMARRKSHINGGRSNY
jgi:hypothetical protein